MGITPDKVEPLATKPGALPSLTKKNIAPHVQNFIQKHDGAAKAASSSSGTYAAATATSAPTIWVSRAAAPPVPYPAPAR